MDQCDWSASSGHNITIEFQILATDFQNIISPGELEQKTRPLIESINRSKLATIQNVKAWTQTAVEALQENQRRLAVMIEEAHNAVVENIYHSQQHINNTRQKIKMDIDLLGEKIRSSDMCSPWKSSNRSITDIKERIRKLIKTLTHIDTSQVPLIVRQNDSWSVNNFIQVYDIRNRPETSSLSLSAPNTLQRTERKQDHAIAFESDPDQLKPMTLAIQLNKAIVDRSKQVQPTRSAPKIPPKPKKKPAEAGARTSLQVSYSDLHSQAFMCTAKAKTDHDVYKLCEINSQIWCGGENQITVINQMCEEVRKIDQAGIQSLTSWSDGQVIVSSEGGLFCLNSKESHSTLIKKGEYYDICTYYNQLYALDKMSGKLVVFKQNRRHWQEVKTIELEGYTYFDEWDRLCVCNRGIYVSSDSNENRISLFDPEGKKMREISDSGSRLLLCAVDANGTLLVANCHCFTLTTYTRDWHTIKMLESIPRDPFHCLTVANGDLWVGTLSGKILKYGATLGTTTL